MQTESTAKLTIEDLLGTNTNKKSDGGQSHSYKIANNQKEYSHRQKIKP